MKRMLEMTYKMPDPKLGVSRPYIGISESKNAYTADQMQQAYAAGREAMRQECVKVCERHNYGQAPGVIVKALKEMK